MFMQCLFPSRALADMNADGKMDKKEFSIAMHLIHKKLLGFELPKVLPPSLKSEVVPGFGAMPGALGMAPPGAVGKCGIYSMIGYGYMFIHSNGYDRVPTVMENPGKS